MSIPADVDPCSQNQLVRVLYFVHCIVDLTGSQQSLSLWENVICSVEVLLSPSSGFVPSVIILRGGDQLQGINIYILPCFRFDTGQQYKHMNSQVRSTVRSTEHRYKEAIHNHQLTENPQKANNAINSHACRSISPASLDFAVCLNYILLGCSHLILGLS